MIIFRAASVSVPYKLSHLWIMAGKKCVFIAIAVVVFAIVKNVFLTVF